MYGRCRQFKKSDVGKGRTEEFSNMKPTSPSCSHCCNELKVRAYIEEAEKLFKALQEHSIIWTR